MRSQTPSRNGRLRLLLATLPVMGFLVSCAANPAAGGPVVASAGTSTTTAAPVTASSTAGPTTTPVATAPVRPRIDRTAALGGRTRDWQVIEPEVPATSGRALIVVLHGRSGTGDTMRALGLESLTKHSPVVLAYPTAVEGSWNDERVGVDSTAHLQHVDDIGFIEHVIADAVANDGVDPSQVALVGFSNGALFASDFACRRADLITSIVLVSGVGGADLPDRCKPTRPLNVLEIHSLHDKTVPFTGGAIGSSDGTARGSAAPVEAMLALWRAAAGCAGVNDKVLESASPHIVEMLATGCQSGLAVNNVTIDDTQHAWVSTHHFVTTNAAWEFLAFHLHVGHG